MIDLAALAPITVRAHRRPGRITILIGAAVGAACAGLAVGRMQAVDTAGFEGALVVLLRFMAACKAAGALGAAALMVWRLGRPIGDIAFAIYLGALALMAAAPGLIWNLALVAPGAVLFHAGLLMFLIAAARDESVPAMLGSGRRHG